jgi:hypothetical protein
MNSRSLFIQIIYFITFMGLQFFVIRNLVLFNFAFCFAYVGFILLLPREMSSVLLLLIALGYGLVADLFYDTLGIHAAASVLLAFLRPVHLKLMTPSGGYETNVELSVPAMGVKWYTLYTLPLIFVHHLALFVIESANISLLPLAIAKAAFSSLFTAVIIVMVQYTFNSSQARR